MPPSGYGGRPQGRSLYKPTLSGGNRRSEYSNQGNKNRNNPKVLVKQEEMWMGRGRGLKINELSAIPSDEKPADFAHGREGWIKS